MANRYYMNGQSLDITKELLEQLKKLVPQAFSEDKLDVTQLKTLLGEDIFVQNERYGLSWAGKNEAYQVMQQPTIATLEPQPEASIDWDEAQHLFIEGENLEVLKLLQKSYFGKVKMIYIDPPYNTGNDSFIYPDKFSETKEEYLARIGEKSDDGYLMKEGYFRKNSRENGQYHSNWLSMMLPRLYLARNLLRDDGVIFVSIDDNEQANLKLLMDEVFGEENFVGCAGRITKKSNNKGDYWAPNFDYILTYVKNINTSKTFLGQANLSAYNLIETEGDRKGEKYQLVRLYMSNIRNRNPDQRYWINCPDGSKIIPPGETFPPERPLLGDGIWRWTKKTFNENKDKIVIKKVKSSNLLDDNQKQAQWNVFTKTYLQDVIDNSSAKPNNFIEKHINQIASHELKNLNIPFDYAKPSTLIRYLMEISKTAGNDLILDFFSGSGTTAQAVMELNEEDNSDRHYICVQLPEKTEETSEAYKAGYKSIAEITQARIQKVIEKIKQQRVEQGTLLDEAKPKLGYRKYKLAGSNFKQWRGDIPQTEQDIETLLDKIEQVEYSNAEPQAMLWELLLKNGYSLTEQVKVIQAGDTPIYLTANQHLAIVLEAYNEQIQAQLLTIKPKQVITLDSLFKGQDMAKANYQLKLKDNDIEFKTI